MTRANTMSVSVHTHLPGTMQISAALLLLRTGSALAFLYHGSAILFGAFGGPGPEAFAASLLIVILGAIFLVHLPHGFDVSNGGAEYALTQLLLTVAFLLTGPGAYSLAPLLPAWLQKL